MSVENVAGNQLTTGAENEECSDSDDPDETNRTLLSSSRATSPSSDAGHISEGDQRRPLCTDQEDAQALYDQSSQQVLDRKAGLIYGIRTWIKQPILIRWFRGRPKYALLSSGRERHARAISTQARNANGRRHLSFVGSLKAIVVWSWVNVLLVCVPVGVVTRLINAHPSIIFTSNALAVIPLSGLLTFATEAIASDMGDTVGALMNVSFGNLVELVIFLALINNQIRIVQASLLGSILVNLLLILGTAILAGGVDHEEQEYSSNTAQVSVCLLCLSVFSLLVPTAFHGSFIDQELADKAVLKLSRGSSVTLLLIYALYLLFQLKTHAHLTKSVSRYMLDVESQSDTQQQAFLWPSTRVFDGESTLTSPDLQEDGENGIELETLRSPTGTTCVEESKPNYSRRDGSLNTTGEPSTSRPAAFESNRSQSDDHSAEYPIVSGLLSKPQPQAQYMRILDSSRWNTLKMIPISRAASVLLLLISSGLIATCAEFLVDSIDEVVERSPLSEAFIGLIILPIAGNVAEHITAMTAAAKDKMDLAIGVSVGSSIQIGLFVTPLVVIIGWGLDRDMTLYFSLFETVALVATAFVVNFLILNGKTNYLEGSMLCACYVIVAVGAYLFPDSKDQAS